MKDKIIRLTKAFSNESVKRLPYILLILVAVGAFQATQSNLNGQKLLKRISDQSTDIKRLSEQNKTLLQQGLQGVNQTKISSTQAVQISKCIANTFATYTQTLEPVQFQDIDKCLTTLTALPEPAKSEQSSLPSSSPNLSASSSNSKPTPKSNQLDPSHKNSDGTHKKNIFGRTFDNVTNFIKGLF